MAHAVPFHRMVPCSRKIEVVRVTKPAPYIKGRKGAVDALLAPFDRSDAPGLIMAVKHKGELLYRRGFGLADVQAGTANTPQTPDEGVEHFLEAELQAADAHPFCLDHQTVHVPCRDASRRRRARRHRRACRYPS